MTTDLDRANALAQWIDEQLAERGMTDREFSRAGGFAHGNLYQLRSGNLPGLKVLMGIAAGFDVPLSLVLKKAGLVDEIEDDPEFDELLHYARGMSDEQLERLLAIARLLYEEEAKREGERTR